MTLTGFAGVNITGELNGRQIAEIQALRTEVTGEIALIFIHFDRDEYLESGGTPSPGTLDPFDIHLAYLDADGFLWQSKIRNVKLQKSNYYKDERSITVDDIVRSEQFKGVFELPATTTERQI